MRDESASKLAEQRKRYGLALIGLTVQIELPPASPNDPQGIRK